MLQTILIGIDGRPQDAEALALARQLADADAELIVASVSVLDAIGTRLAAVEIATGEAPHAEAVIDAFTEAHEGLERVATRAPSVGAGLAKIARGTRADLIVVASSRRGRLGRIFAGDSVNDVLHHAPCAVAVAPVGYTADAAGGPGDEHHVADALDDTP